MKYNKEIRLVAGNVVREVVHNEVAPTLCNTNGCSPVLYLSMSLQSSVIIVFFSKSDFYL